LATPNYGYEKRQKELAKKRKKEEKLKAKAERRPGTPGDDMQAPDEASDEAGDTAAPATDTPAQP
jgi:hypothetical protein